MVEQAQAQIQSQAQVRPQAQAQTQAQTQPQEQGAFCPFMKEMCHDGRTQSMGNAECRMWIPVERMEVNQALGTQSKRTAYVCAFADKTPTVVPIPVRSG